MSQDERWDGIWLEVAEVRFETLKGKTCRVLLKADREQPKQVWWPVVDKAVSADAFETYKAILNEMDKKRMVFARLSCSHSKVDNKDACWLHCDAFRFQSPELGNR